MKTNNSTQPPPLTLCQQCWHEVWALISLFSSYLIACGVIFSAIGLFASSVRAEETLTPVQRLSDVNQGSLLFKDANGGFVQAPTLHTDINVSVSGMIARATVRQTFTNPQDLWVEGVYVFPLPEDAAVDHLNMIVGERIIEGQIKERDEAKRTYEKAKSQGKKASLIEQERPNLFTNSVANIGPREEITVEIQYQQVLHYESNEFRLRIPLAITPRYIPGQIPLDLVQTHESITQFNGMGWAMNTDRVPDASRITPPIHADQEEKINPVSLTIKLTPGFPLAKLESAYHEIESTQQDETTIITFKNKRVFADRDFELSWAPQATHAPKAALFSEKVGEDDYHLIMVLPPQTQNSNTQRLDREVIFIIDTSGSMGGTSIDQAKQSLQLALDNLQRNDKFNIIEFNSDYDMLFRNSEKASTRNLRRARQYVSALEASGGTNMYPAIEAALKNQQESHYVRQIVFLTDGSVGNESELFKLINTQLQNSRLFTVGIGSAPNSHFMKKAAQFGRGSYTYVGNTNEVKTKMADLFRKLENPLMSNINADFGQAKTDSYPRRLPDLYDGEPLILITKTDSNAKSINIIGQRQDNTQLQQWQNRFNLSNGSNGSGIAVLWARYKIADLMDEYHQGGDKEKLRQEIIDVAMEHHLVSKYTSLVAVDITSSRPSYETLNSKAMPVNLPHGQTLGSASTQQTVYLAKTATPAQLNFAIGIACLLIAFYLRRNKQLEA